MFLVTETNGGFSLGGTAVGKVERETGCEMKTTTPDPPACSDK